MLWTDEQRAALEALARRGEVGTCPACRVPVEVTCDTDQFGADLRVRCDRCEGVTAVRVPFPGRAG